MNTVHRLCRPGMHGAFQAQQSKLRAAGPQPSRSVIERAMAGLARTHGRDSLSRWQQEQSLLFSTGLTATAHAENSNSPLQSSDGASTPLALAASSVSAVEQNVQPSRRQNHIAVIKRFSAFLIPKQTSSKASPARNS